jgi:hypothetical protein
LEELLRNYFLQAGFFVMRGVPYRFDGVDFTDIDLWLYDKPTGTARRLQILDAKFKNKPKAVERLFWTRGLVEALNVDGAYVATTDERKILRAIAHKLKIYLLDGLDLKRISQNLEGQSSDRLTEEEFWARVKAIDQNRHNKDLQDWLFDIKGSVVSLGATSLVRSIEALQHFASLATSSPLNSLTALAAGRLAYLSAAIIAISLDFISVESPFRTWEEQKEMFINAIRYGNTEQQVGLETVRLAIGLVRQYLENGSAIAHTLENSVSIELNSIPAEIIADQAIRMSIEGSLFTVARQLERACYLKVLPSFDDLEQKEKSFIGALLDYSDINRATFAKAWRSQALQLSKVNN